MKQALFLLLSLSLLNTYGQSGQVNLTVLNSFDKNPLPFASVYLKASGLGATADLDGQVKFAFQLKKAAFIDTLYCNYIGYKPFRTAVDLSKPITLSSISLEPSTQLKEVVISYIDPLDLIKKAINKIPGNYPQQAVKLNGFLRETGQRLDGTYTGLCESFVSFHNSSYPQPHYPGKVWDHWHDNDEYFMDCEGIGYSTFESGGINTKFNSENDQAKIVQARSILTPDYEILMPAGGPLSITAVDKVKYLRDFLDESNFKRYKYTLQPNENINAHECHVISFIPKESNRRMIFDGTEKTSRAVYLGKIYIDLNSFAIVKTDYQFSLAVEYGYYQQHIPLENRITTEYELNNGRWYLSHHSDYTVTYYGRADRELWIDQVDAANSQAFPEKETLKHTKFTATAYYPFVYQAEKWKTQLIHPASAEMYTQLAKGSRLDSLFAGRFLKNEKLKAPNPAPFKEKTISSSEAIPFAWMKNSHDSEFVSYLKAENAYYKNAIIPYNRQEQIGYKYLGERYVKDSSKNEVPKANTFFVHVDNLDRSHLFYRRSSTDSSLVLNIAELKKRLPLARILAHTASPDKKRFALDILPNPGIDGYILVVNPNSADSLPHTNHALWLNSNRLLYSKSDARHRLFQVWTKDYSSNQERLIYTESDSTFDVNLSQKGPHITCDVTSKDGNKFLILQPDLSFKPLIPFKKGQNITAEYFSNGWNLVMNASGKNAGVYLLDTITGKLNTIMAANRKTVPSEFVSSENYEIISLYRKGMLKLEYRHKGDKVWKNVPLPSKIGYIEFIQQKDSLKNDHIPLFFSSRGTNPANYSLICSTGQLIKTSFDSTFREDPNINLLVRKQFVRRGFRKIPVTLVSNRNTDSKGMILTTYGAYGSIHGDTYAAEDLLFLRRGYTLAYAHIRGEGDLGTSWYNKGRLFKKKNSFKDYLKVATHYKKERISAGKIVAKGTSAGGLVVAAALNQKPELFSAAILDYPFVDVVTSMNDKNLPLTTEEYGEWGNPSDPAVSKYQLSYSPYQNIKSRAYPPILCTAGLYDQQTPTWMTARYVLSLRQHNTSNSEILFYTNLTGGHGTNISGNTWKKEAAIRLAWINSALYPR